MTSSTKVYDSSLDTEPSQIMTRAPSLTIIVAACHKSLGIGKGGSLPWPMLKGEMGYFARVTKRVDSEHSHPGDHALNAVIMGRKTWESIPEKFRPLKGRLNVVISSSMTQPSLDGETLRAGPYVLPSLHAALDLLSGRGVSNSLRDGREPTSDGAAHGVLLPEGLRVSRSFVIGGSSLYQEALRVDACERVLLTKIQKEYDCNVFFPFDLDGVNAMSKGWRRQEDARWAGWTGELEDGRPKEPKRQEDDICYEFCLYERPKPNP